MLKPLLCALAVACLACQPEQQQQSQPRTFQVTTAPGVSLEVIDWGGRGRPLVFLPGGGHSAHVFDEYAPPLTDDYHVIGISRRGSGASSDVPPDSLDQLVGDIVAVLDSLDLERAVLVGHSFGGVEMARFGERYPDRCAGLVYLDAAYDYIDPAGLRAVTVAPPPPPPARTTADSASFEAMNAYHERNNRFPIPEAELRGIYRWDANGRMVERKISETQRRQQALTRPPRWEAIQCPSLGLYPVAGPMETWLGYYDSLTPEQRAAGEAYVREFGQWTAAQRAKFAAVPRNRVVEYPTGNHYFFLAMQDETRRAIRDFVSALP